MKVSRALLALLFVWCAALYGAGSAGAIECQRPPLPEALDALVSSFTVDAATVTVGTWDNKTAAPSDDNSYYMFKPRLSIPRIGFIILPGGNCDPRSYAPAANAIAARGFMTFIIPMPLCVALPTGYLRAGKLIQDHGQIETWVIGGHSVGGTAASIYAVQNMAVRGVVIWASLPNPDPAMTLAKSDVKALSVYGSLDGRATPESVLAYTQYLPSDTVYAEIKGGNHTQFGWIDPSPNAYIDGDNPATISLEEQQAEIVEATAAFLKQVDAAGCPVSSLFGSNDPRTITLARFRDEVLAKSRLGRSIVACYKNNGSKVIDLLANHPVLKTAAGRMLDALIPVIEFFL